MFAIRQQLAIDGECTFLSRVIAFPFSSIRTSGLGQDEYNGRPGSHYLTSGPAIIRGAYIRRYVGSDHSKPTLAGQNRHFRGRGDANLQFKSHIRAGPL